MVVVFVEASKIVPELHIFEEAMLEAKIWKLAASIRDAKAEVETIQFELNMKIMELELKS